MAGHWSNGSRRPPGWSVEAAQTGELQWACIPCFEAGRALEGQPALQTWCDFEPYFSFVDVDLRCEDCGQLFVFAATEQRHWYETLKFWVQSRPKQCPECRKTRRQRRRAGAQISTRLQTAIEQLDSNDPESLTNVASLFLEAGSEQKAAMYLRRAKNKARTDEQRMAIIQRLERLGA